ncbi:MAG: hypothetical protein Fur0044_13590 [Anaerolineae bacterium]
MAGMSSQIRPVLYQTNRKGDDDKPNLDSIEPFDTAWQSCRPKFTRRSRSQSGEIAGADGFKAFTGLVSDRPVCFGERGPTPPLIQPAQ